MQECPLRCQSESSKPLVGISCVDARLWGSGVNSPAVLEVTGAVEHRPTRTTSSPRSSRAGLKASYAGSDNGRTVAPTFPLADEPDRDRMQCSEYEHSYSLRYLVPPRREGTGNPPFFQPQTVFFVWLLFVTIREQGTHRRAMQSRKPRPSASGRRALKPRRAAA